MKITMQSLALIGLLALPAQAITLTEAVDIGIRRHPDLRISEQTIEQAKLDLAETQAGRIQYMAELSSSNRFGQSNTMSTQGTASDIDNKIAANANLGFTLPLFTGFKLTNGIKAAEHAQAQTLADRDARKAEVVFEITQAFLDLSRQELQQEIRREALTHVNRTLTLTKQNAKLGRVTTNEVDRAELNAFTSEGNLLQQETQVEEARSKLAILLGIDPKGLTTDGEAFERTMPEALETTETAGMRSAQKRAMASQAMLDAARGDLWPQLSLASNYQYGNNPYDSTLGARGFSTGTYSGTWDIRLTASLNLLDGGKVERKIKKAESDSLIAQAQLEKTQREGKTAIANAWIGLQGSHRRLLLSEKTRQVAERTFDWIEKRYQQGYALQVEVNEVRSQWVTAKSQHVDALIDYQLARASLKRALGTW